MFIKSNKLVRKLVSLSWMIFNKLENNNNCNFETNGEKMFLVNFFKYLKQISGKGILFDIGANVGSYTSILIDLSEYYGVEVEIHLFEPLKSCFSMLQDRFRANSNLFINNFGLSDKNINRSIFYDKEKSGLASVHKRQLKHFGINLEKSEVISLKRADRYIFDKGIKHINLLKIDVEGHEFYVLKGFGKYLNADFIDFIQFEYGGAWLDSHTTLMDVYYFLKERGFKIAKILKNGLELRNYQPYMENFQYANYVAISQKILDKIK